MHHEFFLSSVLYTQTHAQIAGDIFQVTLFSMKYCALIVLQNEGKCNQSYC